MTAFYCKYISNWTDGAKIIEIGYAYDYPITCVSRSANKSPLP